MYCINGIFYDKIFLINRAFQFGDGFFTTVKLNNTKIQLFNWHLERLIISAKRLFFEDLDVLALSQEMHKVANKYKNGIIKVLIIRNNNNLGYNFNGLSKSLRIIIWNNLPERCSYLLKNGVKLIVSPMRLSRNLLFAGIKHLSKIEYVIAGACCSYDYIANEVIVLDTEDNIIECSSANIFWRRGLKVYTPSLIHAGVSGVMRRLIINLLPVLGYQLKEVIVGIEDLYEAEEVFITNSLLPIASVISIDKHQYFNKSLFNILINYCI